MSNVKYKQYIIVIKPKIEKVSQAKFGVHCAHASFSAYLYSHQWSIDDRCDVWYHENNQTKIIKEIKTEQKLNNIMKKAEEQLLPHATIPDAGFTAELEEGEIIMGCVGPITEQEARELGVWRLSNYKG